MDNPKKRSSAPTPKKVPANNKQGYKWRLVIEGPPDPVTGERTQIPRVRDTINEVKAACKAEYDRLAAGIDTKKQRKPLLLRPLLNGEENILKRSVKMLHYRTETKRLKY